MSKRTDINKVLIIGSGPIIIGQACEFDYSGTQACKALRKLGYEIVLVNSNPATIMTDPEIADVTYIEPLNVHRLEQIIAKERPDALLPNLGGQSGLNLCSELAKEGILDKYNVQVIGVQIDAIERGEDRIEFKKSMNEIGIEMARSEVSYSVDEALAIADKLGYPVVLRPAYTMGGAGGGLVYNKEELKTVCARGLQASLVGQVLVEESILGWEELELEVVRDEEGNMITVCFIENIDPLGVHTGDSFCAAPMLTISKELQARLQEQAYRIVDSVRVIGGTNVQFAHDPVSDGVYKLAAIEDADGNIIPKIKISENVGKITNPHFKKVYRFYSKDSGMAEADYICLHDEVVDDTQPLEICDPDATWKKKVLTDFTARELQVPIFRGGRLVYQKPALDDIRAYCADQLTTLWPEVLRFDYPHNYYVDLSDKLLKIKLDLLNAGGKSQG